VHIDPDAEGVRVRLRVDGVLHEVKRLPRAAHVPLISRIHLMSDTDALRPDVPQVSRMQVRTTHAEAYCRVAVCPTYWGPRATIRILPPGLPGSGLGHVGMSEHIREQVLSLLHRPNGLLLIAGPAGSGRNTTAYACIEELASDGIAVFTVEDPIAAVLPGVTQVPLDPRAGLDYPAAIRALLCSDPDVLYIDDIADTVTAASTFNAAVTGHLVVGSMYAADAPGAVARLQQISGDHYSLAEAFIGAVSQRLVRKTCGSCAETYAPSPREADLLAHHGVDPLPETLTQGRGCECCRGTGYFGRTAIHEVLVADPALSEAIAAGTYAPRLGAQTMQARLLDDGIPKVLAGLTTLREVARVTGTPGL
jgi:type II secretory ATPase GspE/PulE/Tfp pilus assembly ATPase PilB-like protein